MVEDFTANSNDESNIFTYIPRRKSSCRSTGQPRDEFSWFSEAPNFIIKEALRDINGPYIIMNDALFKGNRVSIEHALKKLASRYEETTLTYCAEKEDLINVRSDVRRTSTLNYNTSIIFLVDASWKEGNAGLAVILFDPGAHSWTWSAKSCKADSAVEAEVLAIFWALQLSKDKGHESVTVLSDAQVVANALQARRCPPVWEVRKSRKLGYDLTIPSNA
ncbi:hypothetical protein G4B88_025406 [Cannabis sativa]|uniref:RNase H type-1 domain-containing protein n=1 Tax=Cannabis sativa TaxID=3483 RepID=A0A7J6HT27_CANSA|nr:hypothetical protein G4B88_025406 [Cannabis sativa]